MFIPILVTVIIFGMGSLTVYCQETPTETAAEAQTETESAPESDEKQTKEFTENITADAQPDTTDQSEPMQNPDVEAPALETTEQPEEQTSEQSPEKKDSAEAPAKEMPEAAPIEPEEEEKKIDISETEESIAESEPVGIDTVSLENPQGNWLFKRIWWERSEERYEKIRQLVDSIWESRNTFFHERNQLDRTVLEPFYMHIGIDRGELQTILSEIGDFLEKHHDQQELSEQERILASEEETLKQLKRDIDMITNLDQAIDDALGTFMNQINRVRNYEAEAWKNFREIARILNDTKARELYYMIEGAARNIKAISTYLEQEFFTHFHKLVEETKMRVTRVQNQMEALKEKGVLFQKQAEQLELQAMQEEMEQEEEVVKPKPKTGWFDWVFSGISSAFEYVWSIIRLPYDLIFGK